MKQASVIKALLEYDEPTKEVAITVVDSSGNLIGIATIDSIDNEERDGPILIHTTFV